jgi:hypothetical protein
MHELLSAVGIKNLYDNENGLRKEEKQISSIINPVLIITCSPFFLKQLYGVQKFLHFTKQVLRYSSAGKARASRSSIWGLEDVKPDGENPDDVGPWINKTFLPSRFQKQPHYLHAPHFTPDEAHRHRHLVCIFELSRKRSLLRYRSGFSTISGILRGLRRPVHPVQAGPPAMRTH